MLPVFILTLLLSGNLFAQNQYTILSERPNEKTFKGIISKEVLVNDTSFTWYAEAQKIYTPAAAAVEALQKNKDSVELLVFMGTWCEDSHFVIPKFFLYFNFSIPFIDRILFLLRFRLLNNKIQFKLVSNYVKKQLNIS